MNLPYIVKLLSRYGDRVGLFFMEVVAIEQQSVYLLIRI